LKPGLKVEIRPDAYSDTIYSGAIATVANLAQNKDSKTKIKIFPVQIRIEDVTRNLLPGLTVSCKIIISEMNDVLYIPVEAVFKDHGVEFVYVKSGSGFKRRDIVIGSVNTDYVVIKDGLREDEELALSDPFLTPGDNTNPIAAN
jgi:HlyD family secretion protein